MAWLGMTATGAVVDAGWFLGQCKSWWCGDGCCTVIGLSFARRHHRGIENYVENAEQQMKAIQVW